MRIKKLGKLPLELTKFYAAEILNALEFMSENQIVHRDLKPENVFLDSKWHVKKGDFGDSKTIEEVDIQEGLKKFEETIKEDGKEDGELDEDNL